MAILFERLASVAYCGSSFMTPPGNSDFWVMRIPASGALQEADFVGVSSVVAADANAVAADTSVTRQRPSLGGATGSLTPTNTSATATRQYP
jgi:hypothetical protein